VTNLEIVELDWAKNNSKYELEVCIEAFKEAEIAAERIVRYGNTVFMVWPLGKNSRVFHTINADTKRILFKNLGKFYRCMKFLGYLELVTYCDDIRLLNMCKSISYITTGKTEKVEFSYYIKIDLRRFDGLR